MICIKCQHKTSVINSRPSKKQASVWRRRQCQNCKLIVTTTEAVALDDTWDVIDELHGKRNTFSQPVLIMSIYKSLSAHGNVTSDTAENAYWLAATIGQSFFADHPESISTVKIRDRVHEVLGRFDSNAALHYGLTHNLFVQTQTRKKRSHPRLNRK